METSQDLKSELELSIGVATIRVALNDFVVVVRSILGAFQEGDLPEEIKVTIGRMISEVRKSNDATVDVFAPFFTLDNQGKFDHEFANLRATFIKNYLKRGDELRTHSHIVSGIIGNAIYGEEWKQKWPIIGRQVAKLQRLCDEWITRDHALEDSMKGILNGIDRFLSSIANMKDNNPTRAYDEFRERIELIKEDLAAIRTMLSDLTIISGQLGVNVYT